MRLGERVSDDVAIGIDRNPRLTRCHQSFENCLSLRENGGWNLRSHLSEDLENAGFIAGNSNSIGRVRRLVWVFRSLGMVGSLMGLLIGGAELQQKGCKFPSFSGHRVKRVAT